MAGRTGSIFSQRGKYLARQLGTGFDANYFAFACAAAASFDFFAFNAAAASVFLRRPVLPTATLVPDTTRCVGALGRAIGLGVTVFAAGAPDDAGIATVLAPDALPASAVNLSSKSQMASKLRS